MMTKIFHLAVLGCLAPGVAYAQPAGKAPPPPPVVLAAAAGESITDRIEALGTLRANESVELTATVTQTIAELGFSDGERVKKGQVLASMTSQEERALLNEATATADEARRQFERAQQLAKTGATSVSSLDEARRNNDTAQARLKAIDSRYRDLIVLAPFDGVVGLRNISVGALVRPGDLITTIDDDRTMKLDFAVPSRFLGSLAPGLAVEAKTSAFGDEVFRGEILSVDSRVDPVTRTVTVRAQIPNPERLLKPGLLMTVELLGRPRTAVMIPEGALMPLGTKSFVLVVSEESGVPLAQRREVEIGARQPGSVEILSGIQPGERVVTHGTQRASQGGPVRISAVDDGKTPVLEQVQAAAAKR